MIVIRKIIKLFLDAMQHPNPSSLPTDAPWNTPWPASELERVPACPVCGSASRTILHEDLIDNVFFVAPGKWTLHSCTQCSSAYLDPRPTQTSIGRAYETYYTHQKTTVVEISNYATLSPYRKLRRCLVNGYTNWRYSTCAQPSSVLGVLAAFAIPSMRKVWDIQYRHMPRLPKGGGRLLDVGCGDGSFLDKARTCGWEVFGLDSDPKAAANAIVKNLTVHEGGVEYFDGKTELFDVVHLNHVIEHLYDPVKVLKACHALLKPGGELWLETPNIDSFGYARFKKNWRGLETPRHLVIFNRQSLALSFISAGFPAPRDLARPSPCAGMFRESFAMEHGRLPHERLATPRALQLRATISAFAEIFLPSRREFLIVKARKAVN